MINFWTKWVDAVRFTYEAQSVISQRLLLLATGDPGSADEVIRMISEKVDAFGQANKAASPTSSNRLLPRGEKVG